MLSFVEPHLDGHVVRTFYVEDRVPDAAIHLDLNLYQESVLSIDKTIIRRVSLNVHAYSKGSSTANCHRLVFSS